jgi:hypothetical protein
MQEQQRVDRTDHQEFGPTNVHRDSRNGDTLYFSIGSDRGKVIFQFGHRPEEPPLSAEMTPADAQKIANQLRAAARRVVKKGR